MDATLQELQAALAALRAELDTVKEELRDLRRVVQTYEEDGERHVLVECTDFVLRPHDDSRMIAIQMGTLDSRGFLNLQDWKGDPRAPDFYTAVEIAVEAEGRPVLRLRGSDYKSRAEFCLDKDDCGVAAVFSPGYKPGACMKAATTGGSVAVLQPDGKPRAAMIHHEGDADSTASTRFWLLRSDGTGTFKVFSDENNTVVTLGSRAEPSAISLSAREDSSGLILYSPGRQSHATILAHSDLARLSVFNGEHPGAAATAGLAAGAGHASLLLDRPDGTRGCEVHASREMTGLLIKDTAGTDAVELSHYHDRHTVLTLRGSGSHSGVEAVTAPDLSSLTVNSPHDRSRRLLLLAKETSASLSAISEDRITVQLSQDDNGGFITTTGPAASSGNATMRGGSYAGSFVVGTGDGTALLGIGATDHGGQLVMNNDLGFQRIFMGVHAESSTLHFNHTGSPGIQVTAGPDGGVISVHDSEGRIRQVIDAGDDEDD